MDVKISTGDIALLIILYVIIKRLFIIFCGYIERIYKKIMNDIKNILSQNIIYYHNESYPSSSSSSSSLSSSSSQSSYPSNFFPLNSSSLYNMQENQEIKKEEKIEGLEEKNKKNLEFPISGDQMYIKDYNKILDSLSDSCPFFSPLNLNSSKIKEDNEFSYFVYPDYIKNPYNSSSFDQRIDELEKEREREFPHIKRRERFQNFESENYFTLISKDIASENENDNQIKGEEIESGFKQFRKLIFDHSDESESCSESESKSKSDSSSESESDKSSKSKSSGWSQI